MRFARQILTNSGVATINVFAVIWALYSADTNIWFVDATFGEQLGLIGALLALFYMMALSLSVNYRLAKLWRQQIEGRYLMNVGQASMAQSVICLLLGCYFLFLVGGEINAIHYIAFCGLIFSGILGKKLSDSIDVCVDKALGNENKHVLLNNQTPLRSKL